MKREVEQVWIGLQRWEEYQLPTRMEIQKRRKKNPKTNVFSFKIIPSSKNKNEKEHFFFLVLRNQAKTIRAIFLMYYEPLGLT